MNLFPRNLPIQRKVMLIVLATCLACLLVACTGLFLFDLTMFRRSFVRDLAGLGEITASSSRDAVAFADKDAAEAILDGLKARPEIVGATIVRHGAVFATFRHPEGAGSVARLSSVTGSRFEGNTVVQAQPIVFDNEAIGMLYLRSDYGSVYRSLLRLFGVTVALVLGVSAALAVVISSRLQRFVSEPILRLAGTARSIAQNKDYSVRAEGSSSEDEVGLFTDAFNQMLTQIEAQDSALQHAQHTLENQVAVLQREISERQRAEHQLADAHRQLVETSRQAGMAEVATGVLHNVGNVLNSVNVSATLVSDRVRHSKAGNLLKASELLREHAATMEKFFADDPRAKLLLEYLPTLGTHLTEERAQILDELELLTKNLEHIKEIVVLQQNYARVSGVAEPVSLAGLAEDALQINAAGLAASRVGVLRRYDDVPPVVVDNHRVLQILVNLVRNARQAMEEAGRPHKILEILIRPQGTDRVRVSVIDNGVGISPDDLVRVFSHGFTTKSDGHGFGLHTSANAARDMGGSLCLRKVRDMIKVPSSFSSCP